MDVFGVHERLIEEYSAFTSSLVEVRDARIAAHLRGEQEDKVRWPDPWLSLNPNFEPGGTVTELVEKGTLHPYCDRFFRAKKDPEDEGNAPSPCTDTSARPSKRRRRATATSSPPAPARARACPTSSRSSTRCCATLSPDISRRSSSTR